MMLPASILVFHGHPLLLQQALYLSYSETTLPQAILLPHSSLTVPSAMSDASFRSPDDIWTLFRSLPHYLIVSAILCLSLCPRSPPRHPEPSRSHHDASRDCPRAPRHPPSSAALFVSLLLRQNPSSALLCAPELSYLIHCHLGCLHSVAHP